MLLLPLNKYQELYKIRAQLGEDDMIRIVNNGRPNQEQQQRQEQEQEPVFVPLTSFF